MAKNPFTYDSQAQAHKKPGTINSLTVSPKSASVSLEYFDGDGKPLTVKNLDTPVGVHESWVTLCTPRSLPLRLYLFSDKNCHTKHLSSSK